jgi:hypothetical protein
MKFEILSVSLLLSLSLCGCTSSDKTEINHLEKDTEGGVKALGKEADKAGKAISSSVNELKSDQNKNDANKSDKNENGKDEKPSDSLKQDATKTMNSIGKEADKADRAIEGALKDAGKKMRNADKDPKGKHE